MENQILLYYGYEEGECGIYHAFEAVDPAGSHDEALPEKLAEMLDVEPDSPNFNWDCMYINLPSSVVERIRQEAIRDYRRQAQTWSAVIE